MDRTQNKTGFESVIKIGRKNEKKDFCMIENEQKSSLISEVVEYLVEPSTEVKHFLILVIFKGIVSYEEKLTLEVYPWL